MMMNTNIDIVVDMETLEDCVWYHLQHYSCKLDMVANE